MKKLLFLLLLFSGLFLACEVTKNTVPEEQKPAGYLDESQHYQFFSHFWVNMHHFLYNHAKALSEQPPSEVFETAFWETLSATEKQKFLNTLQFYQDSLIQYDLRTGGLHFAFKKWCIAFSNEEELPDFEALPQLSSQLNQTKDFYKKYFWIIHNQTNQKVLSEHLEQIKKLEKLVIQRLVLLTQTEWTKEKIRVDISYHSKREIPYTTTRGGVHIVMDSGNSPEPRGNWLELLFHESSHHLIFPKECYVGDLIVETAEELDLKIPRSLWHAYLFYFSGRVTKELLEKDRVENYELYMVRDSVFHWIYPLLDKYLPAYLDGKEDLKECTKKVLVDWNNS